SPMERPRKPGTKLLVGHVHTSEGTIIACRAHRRHQQSHAKAAQPSFFLEQPASAAGGVLLGERVGGNSTPAVLAACARDSALESYPKGHTALSHSSF